MKNIDDYHTCLPWLTLVRDFTSHSNVMQHLKGAMDDINILKQTGQNKCRSMSLQYCAHQVILFLHENISDKYLQILILYD